MKIGGKIRYRSDGQPLPQIAIPTFGYKNHIGIDRRYGFIRACSVTAANSPDGRELKKVLVSDNTSSDVWADTAYRSQSNEKMLRNKGLVSKIHRKKPKGKPMPERTKRANARKSKIRARVEHPFAYMKNKFGVIIRTIGLVRAEAKLTLVNLAYNFDRLVFHERRKTEG